MVAPVYNPSAQEAGAGDFEFKANLGYVMRLWLSKKVLKYLREKNTTVGK